MMTMKQGREHDLLSSSKILWKDRNVEITKSSIPYDSVWGKDYLTPDA